MSENDDPTVAEEHWASRDPEGQPPRAAVLGLPRMVLESRSRLGPTATPAAVAEELRAAGVEITTDQVGAVWDRGGAGYAADANSPSAAS